MTELLAPPLGVLLVDDEPAWLRSVSLTLARAGITNTVTCQDGRLVMDILAKGGIGLVLLDLTMPHLAGEDLLALIGERCPEIATIVVSGMNQVETAVRCMKLGAFDYFVKTVEEDRLVSGVVRALRMLELERENRAMTDRFVSGQLRHPKAFASLVTGDRTMHAIFSYIEAVAASPKPLLISGESGVGKELIARAAHGLSGCSGPLVSINVAGLDDTVFADALFGHVRGAYTGADQTRRGMIEEAAHGTLFLDEIGDLSIPSQVKLLRLLQEGEYFPLGSDRPKRLKARIIVATHRDLAAREASGGFRRDLYYRLRTHQIHVPPLRERMDDVPLLVEHFLAEAARTLGKKKPTPPRELFQLLATYRFPGNVRELKAMIFDAVSVHRGGVLSLDTFIRAIGPVSGEALNVPPPEKSLFAGLDRLPTFAEAAELLVVEAMTRSKGNQTIAARLLGISQPALSKRLKLARQ
ncbi:sigma-54 dependent transcriptional regulator [Geobacter hydrogenophilus]|uniref:Sigma-54-dependent Fis family transcriptional regulator n=1 Tax=Geobacter hydrogenophilus TaxID=40983 RepID=A0A9W6LDA2_9BACT|nr:sigma-54 dependent transcriptional regulator [Geobacter hydrogenophilus]MBT0895480.1 sigma-54 dependent transcriptional regulator [Geobacter hydrogenophilus]GLI38296.1 sigma-54-dependent Fis family transcriptional regulator [Geobacter hydrogenophilus]